MDDLEATIHILLKDCRAAAFLPVLQYLGVFGFGQSNQIDKVFGFTAFELLIGYVFHTLIFVEGKAPHFGIPK